MSPVNLSEARHAVALIEAQMVPSERDLAVLRAALDEIDRLREVLHHTAVAAVVAVVQEAERQYQRAEAAHELKDEANRRWLAATTKTEEER